MKYSMYVLKDKKGSYMEPFFVVHEHEAIRIFGAMCRQKDTIIGQYPYDFDLYLVGRFERDTGKVVGVEPEHVCGGEKYADLQ